MRDQRKMYKVAGYTKLAKLWERSREDAISLQHEYYEKLCEKNADFSLVDVYVDITGNKEIRKRPEMIRLLKDCTDGKITLLYAQTKGYLAANTKEFCYLLKFLFEQKQRIDFITEDETFNINTIVNDDHQREELIKMADKYAALDPSDYRVWKDTILREIENVQ